MTSLMNPNDEQIAMTRGASSSHHYQWVLNTISRILPEGKILDYGAGGGELLRRLTQKGNYELCGSDFMLCPDDLKQKVLWKTADLNNAYFEDWENTFDIVTAVEVIEHLENPRRTIRELKKMIKPGGWLILTTPNPVSVRSLLSLAVRGHYVDFLDSSYPAHITPVLPMDLSRILRESGFSNYEIIFSDRGVLPVWTSVTWQALSFKNLRGQRFSDHIFVIAKKGAS